MTTHEEQQKIWDAEHANPHVLVQMDKDTPSSGVIDFWNYLVEHNLPRESGIEMGCGKGRNSIWLSKQGVRMIGFDFSPTAITEAKRRAALAGTDTTFLVQDATIDWPQESGSYDFVIDCFASTDIESAQGRTNAISEMHRVVKPGGHLLSFLLSTDEEFHKEMMTHSPGHEKNSFVHTTGKFEKVFDDAELAEMYKSWGLVESRRVEKVSRFFDVMYNCRHFWRVYKKPV